MRLFKNFALVFLFIGTLASCDGMDATYKEFIEEGPIVYIGKVDSLKAYAGRNRAMLEWQKLLDPRAKTAKIFWENRTRSTELQLTDKAGLTQVIVKDLAEGSYVFEVCTYDTHGNSSIMSEVPCTVYGDVYEKFAPYSFKKIREKVKELGMEYTAKQYTVQVIIFAGGAFVVSYLYFYNIAVSIVYMILTICVIPYLAYLRCKRIYSEFIFEQIQVYNKHYNGISNNSEFCKSTRRCI